MSILLSHDTKLIAGSMTRGNQREIDRARAAKRAGGGKTLKDKDGLTPEQRKERYCTRSSPQIVCLLQDAVPMKVSEVDA